MFFSSSYSWSGVIGALIRDEAEVGVCVFYRTPSRSGCLLVFSFLNFYVLLSVTVLMFARVLIGGFLHFPIQEQSC